MHSFGSSYNVRCPIKFVMNKNKTKCQLYEDLYCCDVIDTIDINNLELLIEDVGRCDIDRQHHQLYFDRANSRCIHVVFLRENGTLEYAYVESKKRALEEIHKCAESNEQLDTLVKLISNTGHFENGRWIQD